MGFFASFYKLTDTELVAKLRDYMTEAEGKRLIAEALARIIERDQNKEQ